MVSTMYAGSLAYHRLDDYEQFDAYADFLIASIVVSTKPYTYNVPMISILNSLEYRILTC